MTEDPHPDIERILAGIRDGDGDARAALLGAVYDELRRLAGGFMKRERADHTLQPTALVHEAWIRLAGDRGDYRSRAHFFGAASEAMRRILVDRARRLAAAKRGGDRARVTLHDLSIASEEPGLCTVDADGAPIKPTKEEWTPGTMHIHDLNATILHLLGIDHRRLTYRYQGRDFRLTDVAGNVLHDVIS